MNTKTDRTPLVSVVIPFFNGAPWLCEAVESVLAQDFDGYEILVVNDGSKESLDGFLQKYSDTVKYFVKENGGPASARNFGIRNSTGKYVAFLDSDDLWEPQKLSVQIDEMLKSGAKWSYTDYITFGENSETVRKIMHNSQKGLYNRVDPHIGTPTVMVERAFMLKNDLMFYEDLRYGQDSCLWERIVDIAPVLYIPCPLSRVRMRGGNASRLATVQLNARAEVYDKCVDCIPGYKHKKSHLYRFAMSLCRFGRIFVKSEKKNNRFVEFAAKILFFVPYVLFKLDRKINSDR